MPLLLRLQGLPRPGRSRDEAEGAPEDLRGDGSQEIPQKPKCCLYHQGKPWASCTTRITPGSVHLSAGDFARALVQLHVLLRWHPRRIPLLQGWLWSSAFQTLPCLTGSWLCRCGFQPSGLQPSGGRMAAAQRARHLSGLAPTTSPLEVTHAVLQPHKQLCPMQGAGFPQNPGQKLP